MLPRSKIFFYGPPKFYGPAGSVEPVTPPRPGGPKKRVDGKINGKINGWGRELARAGARHYERSRQFQVVREHAHARAQSLGRVVRRCGRGRENVVTEELVPDALMNLDATKLINREIYESFAYWVTNVYTKMDKAGETGDNGPLGTGTLQDYFG